MSQSSQSQSQRQSQRQEERECSSLHADLAKKIESNQVKLVNPRNDELQQSLNEANLLLENVPSGSTRELGRNFALFGRMAELAVQQSLQAEKNNSKFTPDVFVARLASNYCEDDDDYDDDGMEDSAFNMLREKFDWAALGRASFHMLRSAPSIDLMSGPMHLEPKERKKIQRQRRGDLGELTKAQVLDNTNEENEEHTSLMHDVYEDVKGFTDYQLFWPFTLQPDLGSTVLRVFACCFLAREGKLSIKLNAKKPGSDRLLCPGMDEGELLVGPLSVGGGAAAADEDADGASQHLEPLQFRPHFDCSAPYHKLWLPHAAPNLQFIMCLDGHEYREKCGKYGKPKASPKRKKGGSAESNRPAKAARS
jgi:hypothetical protein